MIKRLPAHAIPVLTGETFWSLYADYTPHSRNGSLDMRDRLRVTFRLDVRHHRLTPIPQFAGHNR